MLLLPLSLVWNMLYCLLHGGSLGDFYGGYKYDFWGISKNKVFSVAYHFVSASRCSWLFFAPIQNDNAVMSHGRANGLSVGAATKSTSARKEKKPGFPVTSLLQWCNLVGNESIDIGSEVACE
jgi:hypothetical protein